jgi:hypothetical protein
MLTARPQQPACAARQYSGGGKHTDMLGVGCGGVACWLRNHNSLCCAAQQQQPQQQAQTCGQVWGIKLPSASHAGCTTITACYVLHSNTAAGANAQSKSGNFYLLPLLHAWCAVTITFFLCSGARRRTAGWNLLLRAHINKCAAQHHAVRASNRHD